MRASLPLIVLTCGMFLSGCAGPRYAQEINRLKANVGLLDQRLGQLERASIRVPKPAQVPTQPPTAPAQPSTRDIQRALKAAGFDHGPIDGKLGPRTRQAVREFQQVNGLQVDGIVGKKTWAKLAPFLELAVGDAATSALVTPGTR